MFKALYRIIRYGLQHGTKHFEITNYSTQKEVIVIYEGNKPSIYNYDEN